MNWKVYIQYTKSKCDNMSKLEKWINRIVTAALVIIEAVKAIIQGWN